MLLDKIGRRDLSEKVPGSQNASPAALEVSKMRCSLFTIMVGLLVTEVEKLKYFFKVPQGSKIEDGIDLAWYLLQSDNLGDLCTGLKSINRQDLAKIVETEKQKSGSRPTKGLIMAREKLRLHEKECQKHPGHRSFIPVGEFGLQHLPELWQNELFIKYIKVWSDLTVRIRATRAVPGKQIDRICGTGFVTMVERSTGSCTCKECINHKGQNKRSWIFHIATSTCVVSDDSELENTLVDFFYDYPRSREDGSVKTLEAGNLFARNEVTKKGDGYVFTCVCHDDGLAATIMYQSYQREKLEKELNDWVVALLPRPIIIISHPHGKPKHVTVGELIYTDAGEDHHGRKACLYNTDTCPGCSGAPLIGVWDPQNDRTNRAHHSMRVEKGVNKGCFA